MQYTQVCVAATACLMCHTTYLKGVLALIHQQPGAMVGGQTLRVARWKVAVRVGVQGAAAAGEVGSAIKEKDKTLVAGWRGGGGAVGPQFDQVHDEIGCWAAGGADKVCCECILPVRIGVGAWRLAVRTIQAWLPRRGSRGDGRMVPVDDAAGEAWQVWRDYCCCCSIWIHNRVPEY